MIPSFFTVQRVAETASTNEDVKRAAEQGAAAGLVIQAARQSSGKGRQGRVWSSPEGNLYVSLLLRPACDPSAAGLYTFVTSLAVYDTVRAFAPEAKLEIKWPNDVLANGGKISGILLEAAPFCDGRIDWLVVGTGINVATAPEGALYPTMSMAGLGVTATVEAVLETYLTAFQAWHKIYEEKGFSPLRERWLDRAKKGGMIARLPNGQIEGSFADLDEAGRLVLRLPDGSLRTVSAADVFFV